MSNSLKLINRSSGSSGGMSDEYGTFLTLTRLLGGSGVVEGMQVTAQASPNMTVLVGPGTCLVPTGSYPTSYAYHCFNDTVGGASVTIGTANVSNPRIDYIVAYVNLSVTPNNTLANNPNSMFLLADVQGSPASSPVVPTLSQIQTTIGASNPYIILAQVLVGTSVTQITNGNITDLRTMALPPAQAGNGWQSFTAGTTLTYNANNGNKEFVLNTSSNLTGTLSPGMKLSVTRGTAPPTQCMNFASASSQYATKASPSGITFTAAFTCEAWVYMQSYTGSSQHVISRRHSTTASEGFDLEISSGGQVSLYYGNASTSGTFTSYQAIPLNQWVHIAGTATVGTITGKIYINGTSVPITTTGAATTMLQGSDLSLGAYTGSGGPSFYFNGYISEARIWSVAQSQASIQANMAISLTGTETNLVALFQGNGNFNDATSNGNGLTAQNGASATQSSNPFNAIEYANIRAVSSSTITLYTDAVGAIPNQTLNNPQYSIVKEPYGLPEILNSKVLGKVLWCANVTTTATATGTQMNGATLTMTIPTGGKQVVMKCYVSTIAGTGVPVIDAYWGSTQIQRAQSGSGGTGTLGLQTPAFVASSGSQTFSLDMWETSAGTCTATGSTTQPIWFTVEEV